ncbi:MAG: hypothetical protein ACLFTE_09965 [Salinivenus sp.]
MFTYAMINSCRPTTLAAGAVQLLQRVAGALVGLCLALLLACGGVPAHAQVQIEQVEDVASEIEGVTSEQLTAKVGEEAEEVSRDDVLGLTGASPLPGGSGSGANAVVEQRGDNNDATVSQEGEGHEASVAQLGNRNEMSITQGPTSRYEGSPPSYVEGTTGSGNLAVGVQDGSDNATDIRQYGSDNIAGIRLDGSDNAMELLQVGNENEYLLDHAGDGLDLTGSRRVEQIGNNNLLRQQGAGTPISVQMKGEGMRMEITHTP